MLPIDQLPIILDGWCQAHNISRLNTHIQYNNQLDQIEILVPKEEIRPLLRSMNLIVISSDEAKEYLLT